jgi:hypothetical protein
MYDDVSWKVFEKDQTWLLVASKNVVVREPRLLRKDSENNELGKGI